MKLAAERSLELDLDLDVSVQAGSRHVCAVLRCQEERQLASTSHTKQDQSSAPFKNITSLTVFRADSSTPSGKQLGNPPGVVMATLTSQQPRLIQVSNGVKVDGVLDGERASLTLELTKSNDCMADFVCQVQTVNTHGEYSLTSARVHQNKRQQGKDNQMVMSSVTLQILNLVHQLGTKLAVASLHTENLGDNLKVLENKMSNLETNMALISKSTEQLEHKVENLEKILEHPSISAGRVAALENRLEDKIASVERSLQNSLSLLQNRIEDKLKDDVEDKVDEVNHKITSFINGAESHSQDARKSLNESFTALGHHLKVEQTEALTNLTSASNYLLDIQSNVTGILASAARNLTQTHTNLTENVLENLAQISAQVSESGVNVSRTLTNDLTSLGEDLQLSFEQLATSINQSAVETLSSANKLFIRTNSTTAMLIKDVLSPKRCTKRVVSVLSHASYPYPLIQPSGDSTVDVPHLCDTVTDGGGWIVIQRRSTGDVDFYQRGWEEYKNGFGDLRGDFWLGNEHIHRITNSGHYELRVELVYQGKSSHARYGQFSISSETSQYTLNVADYSGTAGDALIKNSQRRQFTTIDRDNDMGKSRNCAERCRGGWWYNNCGYSGLNGKWQETNYEGLFWIPVSGSKSLSFSEMKIRHV
ncbi:fibrinogen related protein 12.1 [Elysia marginata]|uniref:Fibrinogen related protein 12.1 n=1 Tax=Elysia marginata TaxID=1093978 RepID=A0AAV4GUJ9_9GAST|nr:fibrinogen related protein 12.1 [Elysia marginata]